MYFILFTGLMLLVLSSCAAPKTAQPTVAPVTPVASPSTPAAVPPISEAIEKTFDEIEDAKAAKKKSDLAHVQNVVNMRKVQLQNLYRQESLTTPFQGAMQIKLFINEAGNAHNSEVIVTSGNFTQEFISSVQNEMANWRFLVRSPLTYTFTIQFVKS